MGKVINFQEARGRILAKRVGIFLLLAVAAVAGSMAANATDLVQR